MSRRSKTEDLSQSDLSQAISNLEVALENYPTKPKNLHKPAYRYPGSPMDVDYWRKLNDADKRWLSRMLDEYCGQANQMLHSDPCHIKDNYRRGNSNKRDVLSGYAKVNEKYQSAYSPLDYDHDVLDVSPEELYLAYLTLKAQRGEVES